MARTLAGEVEPVMALFDCRTMGLFPTTREGPMVDFTAAMFAAEGHDGILSLSLNHGFPWADVPNAGAKMLAVADGDIAVAQQAAAEFGRFMLESEQSRANGLSIESVLPDGTRFRRSAGSVEFSAAPLVHGMPEPLGNSTATILRELGYDEATIAELDARGVTHPIGHGLDA